MDSGDAHVDRPDRFAIVGAGAVGTALAQAVSIAGFAIDAVISRTRQSADRLAAAVDCPLASDDVRDIPSSVTTVFLCVPDDAIETVAATMSLPPTVTVLHTSGVHASSILGRGDVASFHPIQTFGPTSGAAAFQNIYIGIEGESVAAALAQRVARAVGARPIKIPAESKALYHAASVAVANYLVTLFAIADETLIAGGFTDATAGELFGPLAQQALQNVLRVGPEFALTGPIARSDFHTIGKHISAITDKAPQLLPVYCALATETIRLAVRAGTLRASDAEDLLAVVTAGIGPMSSPPD